MFVMGQKIGKIILTGGQEIVSGKNCDFIQVEMESGQMAGVPWFQVWKDGKCISTWNGALVEGVVLMGEEYKE